MLDILYFTSSGSYQGSKEGVDQPLFPHSPPGIISEKVLDLHDSQSMKSFLLCMAVPLYFSTASVCFLLSRLVNQLNFLQPSAVAFYFWRMTPPSKWLVKGATTYFIYNPYLEDFLSMVISHLKVIGVILPHIFFREKKHAEFLGSGKTTYLDVPGSY